MTNTEKPSCFFVVRESADVLAEKNVECEQHGGNCCASGHCCNHGSDVSTGN